LTPTEVDPNSIVVWKFNPEVKTSGWLFKEWDIGSIEVRRMLGDSARQAIGLDIDSNEITSAQSVRSEVGIKALSLVLKFTFKRDKMMEFIQKGEMKSARVMADAILVDLADEMLEAAESISREAVDKVKLEVALRKLETLLEITVIDPRQDEKEFLIDLYARIYHLFETQSNYWSRNWYGNKFTTLSDEATKRIRNFVSTRFEIGFKGAVVRWWDSLRGRALSDDQRQFDAKLEQLRKSSSQAKSETFRSAVIMGIKKKGASAIANVMTDSRVVQARDVKERIASHVHAVEDTVKKEALAKANSERAGRVQDETKRLRQELLLPATGEVCRALLSKAL
jgi:hypothetical protein